MPCSIRDVAKKANVSVATVSKALNGYQDVSEETKKYIQKVANELNYVPNASARNLSSKSIKNVAIIASGLIEEEQIDEFAMALIKGAYKYISKLNMTIAMYSITSEDQKKKSFDQFCKEYSLSGALIMGLRTTDNYYKNLQKSNIPYVTIDVKVDSKVGSSVTTDDENAFKEITQYVIDKNHKNMVLVYGREDALVTLKREQGFKKALQKNNISFENVTKIYAEFLEENSYLQVKNLLMEKGKKSCTVFVCMSDLMAFGVIRAIKECGYKIPEDFSVTGYDGMSFIKYIDPKITTINQNMIQKGYEAARLLSDMIEKNSESKSINVDYQFITGESVKEL